MTEETLRIGNSWLTLESDDEPMPDDNPLRQLDELIDCHDPVVILRPNPHPLDRFFRDPRWLARYRRELAAERAELLGNSP